MLGLLFRSRFSPPRRRQLYASPPRLRQADRNRLFGRSSAMFAFADVFHFFAHELARLRGRRLSFTFIFARLF
jgi:hypothetical protein